MKTSDKNKFTVISIRGKFIYAYLCLINTIEHNRLAVLPNELNELFEEFVASDKLDDWHTKVEDVLPSFILDIDKVEPIYFPVETVYKIKDYYTHQPVFFVDMIENMFWLGISNLYVAYCSDNSERYLKLIVEKMNELNVPLPEFEKVKECSISQDDAWGKCDDLKDYTN